MFKNDVFNILLSKYRENKLSHAFLLETNDYDNCYSDLIKFIKIINCSSVFIDNCSESSCHLCNLIDNGNLPSLITVDPDGTQIKKGQIQGVIERFQTIPIFSKFNIYIINQCDKLNSSSANSLLKFLEEPEDNILGFYITNNKMNVISTIRSRCQEYSVYYELNNSDYNYLDKIILYINSVYQNDNPILYNKTDAVKYFDERADWLQFFTEMLLVFYSFVKNEDNTYNISMFEELSKNKIIKIIELIETSLKYIQSNGNIELILDKFVIEMRNIYA